MTVPKNPWSWTRLANPEVTPTVPGMSGTRRAVNAAFVVLALAAVMLALQQGAWLRVQPGPVLDVTTYAAAVPGSDDPAAGDPVRRGTVAFPTLSAAPVTHLEAAWCAVRPGCDVAPLEYATPGTGTQVADESLSNADHAATVLAATTVVDYPTTGWPEAGGVDDLGQVRGPSAGLAITLYLLEVRTAGDLLGGNRVVATGAVSNTGAVSTVGGVDHKAHGARDWGADVFFVPSADASTAHGSGVQVVGVDSVDDAVAWLCAHGGTGPLCRDAR